MIRFSNDLEAEFFAASGALAFDGYGWGWEQPFRWLGLLDPSLFTIVGKTLTRHPRRGNLRWYNPFRVVRLVRDGVLNAVGLTNPGIEEWVKTYESRVRRSGFKFFCSIGPENIEEFFQMIEILDGAHIQGIEFNPLCPNTDSLFHRDPQAIIECCRRYFWCNASRVRYGGESVPLILKLNSAHDYGFLAKASEGFVEALSFNAVPWNLVFPERTSPLERFGGGAVSGKAAQPFTWKMLADVLVITKTPVIAPSVWEYGDLAILKEMGADAFSCGSVFLRYPWRPTLMVKKWQQEVSQ